MDYRYWNEVYQKRQQESIMLRQEAVLKGLQSGDLEAQQAVLDDWDEAIRINEIRDKLALRSLEEIAAAREENRQRRASESYKLEHERSNDQLVEDGRRTYYAECRMRGWL